VQFADKVVPVEVNKNQTNTVVKFLIQVPINTQRKLVVRFSTSPAITDNTSYLFFDQNQPGTKSDVYRLEVVNNLLIKPKLIAPKAEILNSRILFNQYQDKNLLFALKF
jgi:hypothetical protein